MPKCPLAKTARRTGSILSGSTVVRSIACTTSQALYAVADEVADFGAPQPSLHLRVAQLSGTVGAGHATEGIISL